MGNVQGYCKHVDGRDSTRHLIRINQFYDKDWRAEFAYDFQNNEIGRIMNGKFIRWDATYIKGIGDCYIFCNLGKLELYYKTYFLETLKNAAVEHINKAIESKEDKDLIRL